MNTYAPTLDRNGRTAVSPPLNRKDSPMKPQPASSWDNDGGNAVAGALFAEKYGVPVPRIWTAQDTDK